LGLNYTVGRGAFDYEIINFFIDALGSFEVALTLIWNNESKNSSPGSEE